METVPTMISTKDLSYISDMFDWNFVLCKKAKKFSEEVNDEDIKEFLEDVYEMHRNICSDLINMLDLGGNNEQ